MTRSERLELTAEDGHRLNAYLARPEGAPRAGLVVVQEVFGVNSHMRGVVDGFAADGFLAIAPALFDRVERGVELTYGGDDLTRGRALRAEIPPEQVLLDVAAAMAAVAEAGKCGVVGYCWGGLIAWLSACELSPAAAVGYYGGGIQDNLDKEPGCPVMLHYGDKDAFIEPAQIAAVRAAKPDLPVFLYPAGHGFNCPERADFHQESADLARSRTLDFLGKHLYG